MQDAILLNECSPDNYTWFSEPRSDGRRGGGVAVFIKNSKGVKAIKTTNRKNDTFELLVIEILGLSKLTINLIAIYRPPGFSQFNEFLSNFQQICVESIVKGSEIICMGDFNIHVDDINDRFSVKFMDLLGELGLIQLVTQSTHISKHCLDLIIVQEDNDGFITDIVNSTVYVSGQVKSDHLAVIINTNCMQSNQITNSKETDNLVTYRKWSKLNIEEFGKNCKLLLQSAVLMNSYDVNFLVDEYQKGMSFYLETVLPLCVKRKVRIDKPWLNSDLKCLKLQQRKLERIWRTRKTDINFQNFVLKRNELIEKENKCKELYFERLLALADTKSLFKTCNKLFYGPKKDQTYPQSFTGKILSNKFNHYFINKIEIIREEFACIDYIYEGIVVDYK